MSRGNVTNASRANARGRALTPEKVGAFPNHRVLVVDDNRDLADAEAWLLRLCGQTVQQAYDGPAALRIASVFKPDIVFIDLVMPHMNGLELARKLRELPGAKPTIVALTGYDDTEYREGAAGAGFDGYITKPASTIDFLEFLQA